MKKALVALAAVFLAAHLPFLPPTLEDIDSVNFALGVRDFDVAAHQPHPPGYPGFIALAKVSTAVARATGMTAPEATGLAIWSVLSGSALVLLLFALYRALRARGPEALGAVFIAVVSPLFWFTALRPLSDMTGLAGAVAAQALLAAVVLERAGARTLVAGAFVAGLAAGLRSQTIALTLPLLAFALVHPGLRLKLVERLAAVAAVTGGVLVWAIPLVMATGGLTAYGEALGSQAGEDFSGVVMLWTSPTVPVAVNALAFTFFWPWGSIAAGMIVSAVAAAGAARLAWVSPRVFGVIAVSFAPYVIFHLLFHEVVTVRYALPVVVPVAFFAATALAQVRGLLPVAAVCFGVYSAVISTQAVRYYGTTGNPTFALIHDLRRDLAEGADVRRGMPVDAIAYHTVARRAFKWEQVPRPVLRAPQGREGGRLIEWWRTSPGRGVAFAASSRRTDLALFDPQSRRLQRSYQWGMVEPPFVGGARPGNAELHWIARPGWMLDRGWAITAEVGGITARDGWGPHVRPSIAWVWPRDAAVDLMIAGRHLGGASDPPVEISLTLAGRPLQSWQTGPGFFGRRIALPAGALTSSAAAYLPLEVSSRTVGNGPVMRVALEQFDLQSSGTPMLAFESGWQEPEFNPATGISWRWMASRGSLWVRPIGRDVTLRLTGESPVRYYGGPVEITISIADREVARLTLSTDFEREVVLPGDALAEANGQVVVRSNRSFVPAERDGSPDRRELAFRLYSASVR